MAGLCCFHCMLRLSSEGGTVSFRWLHCRLRLSKREGQGVLTEDGGFLVLL